MKQICVEKYLYNPQQPILVKIDYACENCIEFSPILGFEAHTIPDKRKQCRLLAKEAAAMWEIPKWNQREYGVQ